MGGGGGGARAMAESVERLFATSSVEDVAQRELQLRSQVEAQQHALRKVVQ